MRQDPPREISQWIVAPNDMKDWPPTGTVVAVGSLNKDVVVGDRVLFRRRPASALVQDDRNPDQQEHWKGLVRLHADDILGLVEDEVQP